MSAPTCQYFALCTNPADGVTRHPVLKYVPICQRCASRFELEILAYE